MPAHTLLLDNKSTCHVTPFVKATSPQEIAAASTTLLQVHGMGCPRCAQRVSIGLLQMDGVIATEVDLGRALATVWYDPALLQPYEVAYGLSLFADDERHH